MFRPRLPLLIKSIAIAAAIQVVRQRTVDIGKILRLGATIFGVLSVLTNYAPKILPFTEQGFGFGIGVNMTGGAQSIDDLANEIEQDIDGAVDVDNELEDAEDTTEAENTSASTEEEAVSICEDCPNPFSNKEILKKAAPHVAKMSPDVRTALNVIAPDFVESVAEAAYEEPATGAVKPPQDVDKKRIPLCQALVAAGFNKNWKMSNLRALKKNKTGRERLAAIDREARKLSGLKTITYNDIINCFPEFHTDYKCVRNPSPPMPTVLQHPKKSAPPPEPVQHCHWESLKKDLGQSISDNVSADRSLTEQNIITTVDYLRLRTELEIRNLINIFQSKPQKEWDEFLRSNMARDLRGYHVEGTEYYIPWDIFRKYAVCFGER